MDADRFDVLAKRMGARASRRAALGTAATAGVLSALGFGHAATAVRAAQGGACVMAFVAMVRQGASAQQALTPGAARPGELRGELRFALSASGALENGVLDLPDGTSLPVVGQATGHALQIRIALEERVALVAVGVGEQEITRCQGAIDGVAAGPEVGDLGDWHAAGVQQARSGGGGTGPSSAQDGNDRSGNRTNRTDRSGSGGASGGSSGGSGGQNSSGSPSGSSSGSNAPSCPPGETFCDLEDGYCADLQDNDLNCGACGNICASGTACQNGECTATGGGGCLAGQTDCGDACVDLQTDPLNCGQCGLPCASELGSGACIDGVCACSPGTTRCDDVCVNTERDPLNCGGCGNECPDDGECLDGSCAPGETDCPSGQTRCGDACVDTTSDAGNCSACGSACAASEACSGSLCVPIGGGGGCRTGLTPCGPTCADLQTDANNCGACGGTCLAGEACVGGACAPGATAGCPEGQILCGDECRNAIPIFGTNGLVCAGGGAPPTACLAGQVLCNGACYPEGACQPADCPPGQGFCYGLCRDFLNDPGYCGGCENACPGAICSGGACADCAAGLTPCGAACVDTATDLGNCGFCGNLCGTQCLDGRCLGVGPSPLEVGYTCPTGQTYCGDACVDTAEDDANCGQCGNVCNEANVCSGGRCVNSDAACKRIDSNLSACVTRCADTRTDPEHCGGCFSTCGPGSECQGGLCTNPNPASSNAATLVGETLPAFSCPEGQVDCGGVCTDVSFDPLNCGSCGIACGPDSLCDFGVCGAAPAPPETAAEEGVAACSAAGAACDPANPGTCCSGACNGDGACA